MPQDPPRGIELADWIAALRAELQRAQIDGMGESLQFAVGPLELEFELTATRDGGGKAGVRFWVLEAGADARVSSGSVQRVKLTLTPSLESGDDLLVRDKFTDP